MDDDRRSGPAAGGRGPRRLQGNGALGERGDWPVRDGLLSIRLTEREGPHCGDGRPRVHRDGQDREETSAGAMTVTPSAPPALNETSALLESEAVTLDQPFEESRHNLQASSGHFHFLELPLRQTS